MNKKLTHTLLSLTLLFSFSVQAGGITSYVVNKINHMTTKEGDYKIVHIKKRLRFLINEFIKLGVWTITIDDFADELSTKGWNDLAQMMLEFADTLQENKKNSQELTPAEITELTTTLLSKHLDMNTQICLKVMLDDLNNEFQKNPDFKSLNFDTTFHDLLRNRRVCSYEDIDTISFKTDKDGNHIVTEYIEHIEYDANGNVIEDETSIIISK